MVDLGVLGPTYRIVERDMLGAIEQRMRSLSESGELDGLMQSYGRRAKAFASFQYHGDTQP